MSRTLQSISIGGDSAHLAATRILEADGLFTFEADPVDWRGQLVEFANRIGNVPIQDDCDAQGIKTLVTEVAVKGSKLHTDRGSMETPPEVVLIFCEKQANLGGDSIFVDGHELLRELPQDVVDSFSAPNSVCFGYPSYARMTQILNKTEAGRNFLRFRHDSYGFYSPIVMKYLDVFLEAAERLQQSFRLRPGTGIAFRNDRFLHGALPSPAGTRVIHRVLISDTSMDYGFA